MNKTRMFIYTLGALILIAALLLYTNRDSITYVGSVNEVEVDCTKKDSILTLVYESDQRNRRTGDFKQLAHDDHRNQEVVFSMIEKCGMPSLQDVGPLQMNAIWLTIQHANKKYRKKYFPLIEKAVDNGDLAKSQYALMKDRMLMDEGKPQLYGSQVLNYELYKLVDPETVDERRQEMGLEPIEDYLAKFGIDYQRTE